MSIFFKNDAVTSISQAVSYAVDDVMYYNSAYENAHAGQRKMDDILTSLMEKLHEKGILTDVDVVDILNCPKMTLLNKGKTKS
jgi:selenocysteine lyase/cysteine desulfurase